jgi:hypothetical protein
MNPRYDVDDITYRSNGDVLAQGTLHICVYCLSIRHILLSVLL